MHAKIQRAGEQCFGLEKMKRQDYCLERLWMEIPLTYKAACYFQFYPQMGGEGVLATGGELLEYKALPFCEQVF